MFGIGRVTTVARFAGVALFGIVIAGCGGEAGPDTASVSGLLSIDGKPIPGVEVHFLNLEHPNHNALGVTNEEGKFRIVQGAVVGKNTVYFSKVEGGSVMTDAEGGMDAGQFEAMAAAAGTAAKDLGPKQIVPKEYATPESKLTFDVPAGGTSSANFEL